MPKVIICCTSANDLKGYKTGLWLEELAEPYYTFKNKGYQMIVCSIAGGEIPVDPASLKGDFYTETCKKFSEDEQAQSKLQNSQKLSDVDLGGVDAIFMSGGHGTAADFVDSADLKKVVEKLFSTGKVVAAVCHGPVGLAHCNDGDAPLVKGKKVTGFSDSEEEAVGLGDKCPFLLETRFKELGGKYEKGDDWSSYVCVDGNLVTGQNPQSSLEAAKAVVKILG